MRLMTFNLRFANPQDGPNLWDYRKEVVVDTIFTVNPDLVGTQEGTVPQLKYLTEHLQGHKRDFACRLNIQSYKYTSIPEAVLFAYIDEML